VPSLWFRCCVSCSRDLFYFRGCFCFSFFFVRSRAPACGRSAQPGSSCSQFGHPLVRQGAWSALCLGSLNPATAKILFCCEKSSLSLLSSGCLLGFGFPLPFWIFGLTFCLVRLQLVCSARRSLCFQDWLWSSTSLLGRSFVLFP
jgi:hypothetical protein